MNLEDKLKKIIIVARGEERGYIPWVLNKCPAIKVIIECKEEDETTPIKLDLLNTLSPQIL